MSTEPSLVTQIGPWVAVVALLVGVINTVWVWLSQPGKLAQERHEALLSSLKEHDRRIQAVEGEYRHLPTKDDVHELSEQLARLEAKMEAEINTLGTTVRRIDDYLRSTHR